MDYSERIRQLSVITSELGDMSIKVSDRYVINFTDKVRSKISKGVRKLAKCKYCGRVAPTISINRWHNEHCKDKPK